jgi:hypothetical protein
MPGSSKWSLSFRFPHQNPVYASPLPHACYVPCLSYMLPTIQFIILKFSHVFYCC